MPINQFRFSRQQKTPRIFCMLFIVLLLLSFIPTIWPQIDLTVASHFLSNTGQKTPASDWWWVDWINGCTPFVFRVLIGICLLAWLMLKYTKRSPAWRFILGFIIIAGAMGPGAVVNFVVKDNWNRPRPFQVQQFGGTHPFLRAGEMNIKSIIHPEQQMVSWWERDLYIRENLIDNSSFVSGHVACGLFFISLVLVDPKRRYFWAVLGVIVGVAIGFSRIAAGAHWLSDELWAGPITLFVSWVIWRAMLRSNRQ